MASPSWRSIDRDVFASRPLLNNPCGSGNDAPLKKLILMWSLNAPSAHTLPLALHTAVCHLNSSFNSGCASLMSFRRRTMVSSAPVGQFCDLFVNLLGSIHIESISNIAQLVGTCPVSTLLDCARQFDVAAVAVEFEDVVG